MQHNMINSEIIVVAEHLQGRVKPETYEVISFARELQRFRPSSISVIIIGSDTGGMAEEISQNAGVNVIGVDGKKLEQYNAEAYISILKELLYGSAARYICIPHSSMGFDYAPVLAVKMQASCITGVEKCSFERDNVSFTRSIFNGKINIEVEPASRTAVLTILPGAFSIPYFNNNTGSVRILNSTFSPQKSRSLKIIPSSEDNLTLTEADVIVSAGRGIGNEETISLIRRLAGLFPKSAIGGSRTVCDLEWLEYKHQIGITGKSVAPKLYIACGISGAIQHVSGIRGANLIVAINNDPEAAIFHYADYCIVEDLAAFLPILIEEFKKRIHSL